MSAFPAAAELNEPCWSDRGYHLYCDARGILLVDVCRERAHRRPTTIALSSSRWSKPAERERPTIL
jgi:hypothetical protein